MRGDIYVALKNSLFHVISVIVCNLLCRVPQYDIAFHLGNNI